MSNSKKAQDGKREAQQLERLGLSDTARDASSDAFYKMDIDCKTRAWNKAQTTKREYGNKRGDKYDPASPIDNPFEGVVLYCSTYEDPDQVMNEGSFLVFPEALELWTENQARKLQEDNGTKPCHDELDFLVSFLRDDLPPEVKEKLEKIEAKFRQSIFKNDPSIGKTLFDTNGEKIYITNPETGTSKKVDNRYPEWCIPLSDEWDHKEEVRAHIDRYIEWKNKKNER